MGESFPLFFEDLSPCMYVASSLAEGEKLKAVGWLAWGHPYKRRKAKLPEQRFGQLLRLLQEPWEPGHFMRSEEHTSELQSLTNLVCRLLLEKKKINIKLTIL